MFIIRIVILYSLIFILVLLTGCKSNIGSSPGSDPDPYENIGCMDTTNCWEIYYDSNTSISGFQFGVNGVIITDATGGVSAESGFSVTTSTTTVIGFSFSGAIISAGSGILTQIEYEGNINNACITNLILSDPSGEKINTEIINCQTIKEQ